MTNPIENLVRPKVRIESVSLKNGQTIEFKPNDTVLIVGSNNCGKSQTLREIIKICSEGKAGVSKSYIVDNVKLNKTGDVEQLRKFLLMNGQFEHPTFRFKDWDLHESNLSYWNAEYLLGGLAAGFIRNLTAKERLQICEPQPSVVPGQSMPKPQQVLKEDDALMESISTKFERAFSGKQLFFDPNGGPIIPIHVGQKPSNQLLLQGLGTYSKKVREQPLLNEQGDGMQGYAGILFEAVSTDRDVTLVDEPEAFLHPPQMRRLGTTLAESADKQLIVATHSSDVLRGVLEGTRGAVRILRIIRTDSSSQFFEAHASVVKDFWEKPVLKYSNALESIFHEQALICEDDSDCKLFNALADHLEALGADRFPDTAYVPVGGKHQAPKVASALRMIGVPVKGVFDIDLLSNKKHFRETVESFGGDWAQFSSDWSLLSKAISKIKPRSVKDIKDEILQIIFNSKSSSLPKGDIEEVLRSKTPWSNLKKHGVKALKNGSERAIVFSLIRKLERIGIYLLIGGQVESYVPTIKLHGPKYVTTLLSEFDLDSPKIRPLLRLSRRIHRGACAPLDFTSCN